MLVFRYVRRNTTTYLNTINAIAQYACGDIKQGKRNINIVYTV